MIVSPDHIFWLLVMSVLCAGVAIALSYLSRWEAVVAALAALILGHLSRFVTLDTSTIWFWTIATLIVLGINFLLPAQVRASKTGIPYFATGALVGAFVGMLFNTVAAVIVASALGVALGAVAFSRLPGNNNVLDFPSRKFFNYLCAKGLQLVVIYSMLGILSIQLIIIGAAS